MGYLTPDLIPDETICYSVYVPNTPLIVAAFVGAVSELEYSYNWQPFGEMTPLEMADSWSLIYQDMATNPNRCAMIGQVIDLATASYPDNVLPCDGASYLRVDYPDLYAILNSNLITDADNFVVPDLRLKFVRSATNAAIVGNTGGNDNVTLSTAQLPAHSHTYAQSVTVPTLEGVGVPLPTAQLTGFPVSTSSVGSGAAIDIRPTYQTLLSGIVAK